MVGNKGTSTRCRRLKKFFAEHLAWVIPSNKVKTQELLKPLLCYILLSFLGLLGKLITRKEKDVFYVWQYECLAKQATIATKKGEA